VSSTKGSLLAVGLWPQLCVCRTIVVTPHSLMLLRACALPWWTMPLWSRWTCLLSLTASLRFHAERVCRHAAHPHVGTGSLPGSHYGTIKLILNCCCQYFTSIQIMRMSHSGCKHMLLQKLLATAQQVWPFYTGLHSSRFTIQLSLPQPQLLPPAACSAAWCVSVRALETNCRNSATAKMQGAHHVWSETAQL
jgi:hypothetical protein